MKRIIPFMTAALALASCHKEHLPAAPVESAKKLIEMVDQETPSVSTKFTYDTQGRMIGLEDGDIMASLQFNGANTALLVIFDKATHSNTSNGHLTLDGLGRATQLEMDYTIKPSGNDTIYFKYEYNTDGYLSRVTTSYKNSPQVSEETMEYANGNLTKENLYADGKLGEYILFTYSSLEDKTGLNTNFSFYTNSLAGKRNKNLVAKSVIYDGAGNKQFENQYDSELDPDGYLAKRTSHYVNTGFVEHQTYKYDK
jgi:hypothetical protein